MSSVSMPFSNLQIDEYSMMSRTVQNPISGASRDVTSPNNLNCSRSGATPVSNQSGPVFDYVDEGPSAADEMRRLLDFYREDSGSVPSDLVRSLQQALDQMQQSVPVDPIALAREAPGIRTVLEYDGVEVVRRGRSTQLVVVHPIPRLPAYMYCFDWNQENRGRGRAVPPRRSGAVRRNRTGWLDRGVSRGSFRWSGRGSGQVQRGRGHPCMGRGHNLRGRAYFCQVGVGEMQNNSHLLETPARICRRVMERIKSDVCLTANWGIDGSRTRVELDSDGFWGVVVAFGGGHSQVVPFDQLFNTPWTAGAAATVIQDLVEMYGPKQQSAEELEAEQAGRRQVINAMVEMEREERAAAIAVPARPRDPLIKHWELDFSTPLKLYVDRCGLLRIHLSANKMSSFTVSAFVLLGKSWILVGDGSDLCSDLLLVEKIRWCRDSSANAYLCYVFFRWSRDMDELRVCSLEANGKSHF